MSSRNVYLSPAERQVAPAFFKALREAAHRIHLGDSIEITLENARETLSEAGFVLDYLEARQTETLACVVDRREGPIRLLAAAQLRATRLIDNIAV